MLITIQEPVDWTDADRELFLSTLLLAADKLLETNPTSTVTDYQVRSVHLLHGWLKVCLMTKGVRPRLEFEEQFFNEYFKTLFAASSIIEFEHENRGTVRQSLEREIQVLKQFEEAVSKSRLQAQIETQAEP